MLVPVRARLRVRWWLAGFPASRSPQLLGGTIPTPPAGAHRNRSWSWMVAEGGSPQSEEGEASGEDPGSRSLPCLQALSRRRLEQRSASSRASSQQRPGGDGGVSGPGPRRCPGHWGALCQEKAHTLSSPFEGAHTPLHPSSPRAPPPPPPTGEPTRDAPPLSQGETPPHPGSPPL